MAKRAPVKHVKLTAENTAWIEAAVFARVEPLLPSPFYLLAVAVEKEAAQWLLQVFIERQSQTEASSGEAISLQDCEQVSRSLEGHWDAIDAALQRELPMLADWSYNLEISSPGLFRPLKTAREFAFYKGRKVRVERQSLGPLEGKPTSFIKKAKQKAVPEVLYSGILQSYDDAAKTVTIMNDVTNEVVEVVLDDTVQVLLNPAVRLEDEDAVLTLG